MTVKCRAGIATINLKLSLSSRPPPPPPCQVSYKSQRPGLAPLCRCEQRAEDCTGAANAADVPKGDHSEVTDIT